MDSPVKDKILIVDDEDRIRNILAVILQDAGYDVQTAADGSHGISAATIFKPHLVIADLQMPRINGIETIVEIRRRNPHTIALILTAHGTIQSAVQAMKEGVYDYIQKPFDNEQLLIVVRRALEVWKLTSEVERLRHELHRQYGVQSILGESASMERVRQEILQISQTDATVLIEGESGTGKELVARSIHYESKRRDSRLMIVDCAAIPVNLFESELFGHERGAFTDAREMRIGKFEEAHGGTIFLDEIGELPLDSQTKLLRVLQEKEFTRVGGTSAIAVNVRVIAATNKQLVQEVKAGRFREDLFYRLNVLKIDIPPLRAHKEDIPLYVRHFIAKHRDDLGRVIEDVSDSAVDFLVGREWPGNVRELENIIQRAMIRAQGRQLCASDLEPTLVSTTAPTYDPQRGLEAYMSDLRAFTERELIQQALQETGQNRTKAAERLMISRKTLFNKMLQYGIK